MKAKTMGLALFLAAAPFWLAQATAALPPENFVIEINDSNAAGNREVIAAYSHVGTGDVLSQTVEVVNHTANAYGIRLHKAEASGDAALLDALTFTLTGAEGEITLRAADFDKTDWPAFFSLKGEESGQFTLTTRVGELTNEVQGGSCAIAYTFEVVYLSGRAAPEVPPTADTKRLGLYTLIAAVSLSCLISAALLKRYQNKGKRGT